MTRWHWRMVAISVVGAMACITQPAAADVWAGLASDDEATFFAAVDELRKGPPAQIEQLERQLRAQERRARLRVSRAIAKREAIFADLRNPESDAHKRLTAAYARWDNAADAVQAFLAEDNEYKAIYPDYENWKPGEDVQPGQEKIEALTKETIDAWNDIVAIVEAEAEKEGWFEAPKRESPPAGLKVPAYAIHDLEAVRKRLVRTNIFIDRPEGDHYLAEIARSYADAAQRRAMIADALTRIGRSPIESEPSLKQRWAAAHPSISRIGNASFRRVWTTLGHSGGGFERARLSSVGYSRPPESDMYMISRPDSHTSDTENQVLSAVNTYRLALQLPCVQFVRSLDKAAAAHAKAMADGDFFAHENPSDPTDSLTKRVRDAGYKGEAAECIARTGEASLWQNPLWDWRTDAAHHRVLLDPRYTQVGIAFNGTSTVLVLGEPAGE